jgi:hypothetical protein
MPAEVMCGDRPTMLFRVLKLWSILLTPANYERGASDQFEVQVPDQEGRPAPVLPEGAQLKAGSPGFLEPWPSGLGHVGS